MATKKTDTEGASQAEGQAVASKAVKPARKAPSKSNNVSEANEKAPKKALGDNSTVKSSTKARISTSTRAPARGYVRLTDEVVENIIDLLHSNSLSDICRLPGMPERTSFCKRLATDEALQKRYAAACEARADKMVDEIIQIADDGVNDTYLDEEGNKRTDHDVIARSKLRVDARKWAASKMAPKKYGDKLDMNHGVQADNPLASLLAKVAGSALPLASNQPDED